MPLADVSGHKLYYEIHPAREPVEDLPPVVLVMGTGGRCAGWLPFQVPALSAHRDVVIYDHRGVGESTDPGTPFTTADLGRDLVALLDALSLERVDAVGHFLGAMTIQEAAIRAPERFRRLGLIGCWAAPDAKRRMLLAEWAALARGGASAETMIRHRMLWTFSDEALAQVDELVLPNIGYLDDGQTPLTGELFARQCEAAAGHDTRGRLAGLPHHALLLCGRRDLLTPSKFGREIAEEMPNARDLTLSYSGHAVTAERPERLNDVILHFLGDVSYDEGFHQLRRERGPRPA